VKHYGELREICRKVYQETIIGAPIPNELKRSLKAHERVPAFIDNLAREFSKAKVSVRRETIEQAARDMTHLFVNAIHQQAEEKLMSPIKRAMLQKKLDDANEFRKEADALEEKTKVEIVQDSRGFETRKETTALD
jgi:F0F1-type ATP synthase membrane subunit b/b'